MTIRATLVTDGSSDTVLLRVLQWLAGQIASDPVEFRWADLRRFRQVPSGLPRRLARAVELYPCHVLFVHRDAEAQDPELRYAEIAEANRTGLPHVCVVPVRMQEAWLLHNEEALREAAGRPSGGNPLDLPKAQKWDQLADPKDVLHAALRAASGAEGRRAKRFNPGQAAHRLADLITDWSPLRSLPAFLRLEEDMRAALNATVETRN